MYLKSVKIQNFRKFGFENNIVSFASNVSKSDSKYLNSTLIVGQNNAGKTSAIKALQKACGSEKENFSFTDFNYYYLRDILSKSLENKNKIKEYIDDPESVEEDTIEFVRSIVPFISLTFSFCVGIDAESKDLLTNIGSLITNDISKDGVVSCVLRYETENWFLFIKSVFEIVEKGEDLDEMFSSFLKLLDSFSDEFSVNCYIDENELNKSDFNLRDLMKVKTVSFTKPHSSSRLTEAFNKIYKYKVNNDVTTKNAFDNQINELNDKIDSAIDIGKDIAKSFNNVLSRTTDSSKVSMQLKANLNLDSLLNNVIKYVYKDGRFEIPEDQFGMGYTNLMLIISELIDYIDNVPETDFYNKINLLIIEEPESYMHPQMQKVLIENINGAFQEIIKTKLGFGDVVNCQMIITSHSPFVLSGKIDTENTFNNINYIRFKQADCSSIIPLKDNDISTGDDDFEFLKRYIKFKCCELFFADAVIFAEGLAEETILPFFLAKDEKLNKKYISFFNINGAHFHIYEKLIKVLGVPVVILTDLDIEGTKDKDDQITTLNDKTTTNNALKSFNFDIANESNKTIDNIFISTQSACNGFVPMSFEEAIILANPCNKILKDSLEELHPYKFKSVDGSIADKSHKILRGLSNDKGEFAAILLYNMLKNKEDKNELVLPQYIVDGFNFIKEKLNDSGDDDNGKESI